MQNKFQFFKASLASGGSLRTTRAGRKARALATKVPLHLVLKMNKGVARGGLRAPKRFALIHQLVKKYRLHFDVKVEQISIQNDHIHMMIRSSRRSNYQGFFRVLAGQIAQQMKMKSLVTDTPKKESFWKHRLWTRVISGGWRAVQTVRNYIQLNEKEAMGKIPYRKQRLRGLSSAEWEALWC